VKPTLDGTLTTDRLADIKAGRPDVRSQARQVIGGALNSVDEARQANARPYRPVALHADPRIIGPRWPFAVMRIKRILEGLARSSSITDAVNGAEYKQLAREYVETYTYYLTRTRPAPAKGTDHNPFRHMSDFDAFKKFVRCVEDICDRSSSKLGGWYVK
jgi:hypothetical protein